MELPEKIWCQRDGCTITKNHWPEQDQKHKHVVLKRCMQCRQVHYCSIDCQRKDWLARHRIECLNLHKLTRPDVEIATAEAADLMALLRYFSKSCFSGREERSWGQTNMDEAKLIGSRLYAIGGTDLCVSVCDTLREEWRSDKKRKGDAVDLEMMWCHPVIPNWWY